MNPPKTTGLRAFFLHALSQCRTWRSNLVWLAAFATLVFSIALGGLSWQQKTYRQQIRNEARAKHYATVQDIAQLDRDAEKIQQVIRQLDAWRKQGIIGKPDRLGWAEQIRAIQGHRQLLDVQYEFSAPQLLHPASPEGHQFQRSTMTLHLALLHEEDLLHFLDDLYQQAHAYILPEQCSLTRLNTSTPDAAESGKMLSPTLLADCRIEWINLLLPGEKP